MNKRIFNSLRTFIQVEPGLTASEIDYLVRSEAACNLATKDFLCGNIDEDTWLDTLEFLGHNIDDYADITEENLIVLGF